MDRFAEKQAEIEGKKAAAAAGYPSLWLRMVSEWQRPDESDRAWLMYSANYLFRTKGVRWAMDPLALNGRLPQAPAMDFGLLRVLRHLPIWWVVPEAILPLVQREAGLPAKQILVPKPLQPIELHGLRITHFDGLHWEKTADETSLKGVPATGYLVELGGKHWLFPGDTRTYDPIGLPDLSPVDVLFAHLWLGRGAALQSHLPLLDDFCRFCLALQPRRVILTHLEEWGRQVSDFWDLEHAEQVVSVLKKHAPFLPIEVACTGDEILLVEAQSREAPNSDASLKPPLFGGRGWKLLDGCPKTR